MDAEYYKKKGEILSELNENEEKIKHDPSLLEISEEDFDFVFGKDPPSRPPSENGNKKPQKNKIYETYKKYFNEIYPERRFCPIKKNLFIRTNYGDWETASSRENILKSKAPENHLSHVPIHQHLEHWASLEESYGYKERMLIDVPDWDEKDRIGAFLAALKITNMSNQYAYELLCHYLANIWRRIKSPRERNWVLVLHGPQNIGKDWWIKQLLGGWNEKYYYETLNVYSDEVRTFMHLDGKIVIHMSEFEEAKKWGPGFLKDLITKESLSYVGKFKAEVKRIEARHSLVASTNKLDFLTDTSGSSRFFILDVKKVFFDYPMEESMQVLAQSHTLFKKGYTASQDALSALGEEQDRVTPPDINELIIGEFKVALETLLSNRAQRYGKTITELDFMEKRFTHQDLEETWQLLCDRHRKARKTVIGIVKPIFGRKSGSVRYFTLETH